MALWYTKAQQVGLFFSLVVALIFSLAHFLEVTSPNWFGNCQETALVLSAPKSQSSKTLRHRFNFEHVLKIPSVKMDFWDPLRVLFNSSHVLGSVAHLEGVYLAMHSNAGLCFVSLKMGTGTQF